MFKQKEAERREQAALKYAKGLKKKISDLEKTSEETSNNYLKEYDARVDSETDKQKKLLKEAIDAFGKAFSQKPDHEAAQAFYLNQLAHICDWSSIAKDRKLIPSLGISKKSVDPFSMF